VADVDALYASLLAADEARDAAALAAVAWQVYGQLATAAADLGALRARFWVYAAAPHASGGRQEVRAVGVLMAAVSRRPRAGDPAGAPPGRCDQPGRVAVLTCSDPPRLRNGCPLTSSTALSRSGACTME